MTDIYQIHSSLFLSLTARSVCHVHYNDLLKEQFIITIFVFNALDIKQFNKTINVVRNALGIG